MGGWGYHIVLIGIALLFVMGTSVLSWSNARTRDLSPRFHWPDETTNHFFALRVARGESLAVPEPRNLDARNLIHPRTANVRADGAIVPGAYLGLPLWYGMVGRIFSAFGGSAGGERAMLFVTPILAALGLLAFARILRAVVSARVALLATVLLVFHPSVWLFTATTFLPNVPFIALLLMGCGMLLPPTASRLKRSESGRSGETSIQDTPEPIDIPRLRFASLGMTRSVGRWFAGGLLLGLALTIRTHEILWVLAMIAAVATYSSRRSTPPHPPPMAIGVGKHFCVPLPTGRGSARGWGSLVAVMVGIVIPSIPMLILNAQLYGSPFTTGYALLQDGGAAPTEFAPSLLPGWIAALIAPFGWHPIRAATNAWRYLIAPHAWFIVLAVLGFVTAQRHLRTDRVGDSDLAHVRTNVRKGFPGHSLMVVGTAAFIAWLLLFYGSWELADPLVRATNVLTISYVRYWLPVIVVLAPWAGVGFAWFVRRAPRRWQPAVAAIVLLAIVLASAQAIVRDPLEGLLRQRAALAEHRVRARAVVAATPPDAVIVSDRMDKVFAPERAVIHASNSDRADAAFRRDLRALVARAPVYWYAPGAVTLPGFTLTPVAGAPFGEQLARVE